MAATVTTSKTITDERTADISVGMILLASAMPEVLWEIRVVSRATCGHCSLKAARASAVRRRNSLGVTNAQSIVFSVA